ncbi:hypothetical protein L2E82_27843 [Cichorium intybus]|uniref:Uncharacterized protein n=1 Tax=Cichorium intybus TaxID=13427 RepID=A0ACB9CU97_CICIN|nr:hypothetical protein L2E82_27843 [Cichorium intybus]
MKVDELNTTKSNKKQEDNVDSVLGGNSTFVFGSNLGNAFSGTPLSKASHDAKTSNIHDPTKAGTCTNKINEAGTTNFFSFASKVGAFGTSFTGIQPGPVVLHVENKSALKLMKNQVFKEKMQFVEWTHPKLQSEWYNATIYNEESK